MDKKFSVLIVDDEDLNLQIISSSLGAEYRIFTAFDGHDAISQLKENIPDLILLDVMMPDIDGFEVCKIIKANPLFEDIPVIFLTVLDTQEDTLRGLEVGGIDYLTKPINLDLLRLRVRNHIKLKERNDLVKEQRDLLSRQKEELAEILAEMESQNRQLRETDEVLRNERNLIANIMETSPVGITTVDSTGRITFVNAKAIDILGLSRDEITQITYNAPVWNISDIDGSPFSDDRLPFTQVMSTGKAIFDVQHTIQWPDGKRILLSINATPMMDAGNNVTGMIATIEDISEHKKYEKELCKSEEHYRELFNSMVNGFALHEIILDGSGIPCDYRFLAVNAAFERLTNLKAAEIIGRSILEIAPKTERFWIDTYGRVALTREPCHFEQYSKIQSKHYEVNAYSPQTGQFACVFADITERKLADTYKDISREVLMIMNEQGDLKDAIPKVIASLKAGTGFDAVGIRLQEGDDYPYFSEQGFPKELLLKENSLLERNIDGGICRDKDGNACLECTCGLVITGKSEPGHPFFTPGGSFWTNDSFPLLELPLDVDPRLNPRNECIHHNYASVALTPIRVERNIVGLIQFNDHQKDRFTLNSVELLESVAEHIGTALMRKRYEDEKRMLESQLHQAQKMESVGRLAGGVAHDFNNKLTVILGFTNLAFTETNQDILKDYLEYIRKAGEQSADLTRQLLAFARQQTIAPNVLDLNETVSGMLKMLQRLIGEDIHLNWHPSPNLWQVMMDPSQIDQILANLCVNARDSIANVGKITIETGSSVIDKDYCAQNRGFTVGEYVRLSVSDSGSGMDKETLAQIFEPFFTTKGPGEGTGLGLATVYGIVKQNNGFINVYSEPGQGTTFTIYLPRYAGEAEQERIEGAAVPARRGWETILLVEDDPDILKIASMILLKQGYTILAADSPGDAIRLASEHSDKMHLLMTDVVMPEMNGKDLANKLQSLYPQLKCLYMSGYTANVIAHHGVLDAGVHFIQKPYSLPDLAAKVRDVLDGN
ncbi:MAG: response regulator [Desulfuromonadales bacterium]